MCWAVSGTASATNVERRRTTHAGLAADLGAQHALRALQRGGRVGPLRLVAENRVEDVRLLQVVRDARVGDGDEAQPRVLDAHLERLGDDDLDAVGQLAGPRLRLSG